MPDDLESDIQATAEDIAADAAVLQLVEAEKAILDTADPRTLELAQRAKELAHGLAAKTIVEHELVVEARESTNRSDGEASEPEG